MEQAKKTPSRQRVQPLKVWALPAEAAAIKANAGHCGMSVSAYLRALGLKHKPKTVLDADAVMALAKVNGDLGRLGGLLKMWLTNEDRIRPQEQVEALLSNIRETQAMLFEKAKQV